MVIVSRGKSRRSAKARCASLVICVKYESVHRRGFGSASWMRKRAMMSASVILGLFPGAQRAGIRPLSSGVGALLNTFLGYRLHHCARVRAALPRCKFFGRRQRLAFFG